MRPRLLPDTHLLPSERGVVISGPRRTAALPAPGIYPWLERIRPFLDGQSTLDQLTAELPPQAAHHVRTLVELLVREGFVRDAATDLPHGLSSRIRAQHASLIDFIASRADSPEHRFERYRECAPLVTGSGRLASALVLALLASGVAHVRLRLDDMSMASGAATDVARLRACVQLLRDEGGLFCFEELEEDVLQLVPGVGVLLFASDVDDPEAADRARSLAMRAGVWFGQVTARGERVAISAVRVPEGVSAALPDRERRTALAVPSPTVAGTPEPTPTAAPSPYLGGPTAALAANQLCLHLLRQVAGLDHPDQQGTEATVTPPDAVLDLVTGAFLGAEAK
ncbi:hypothetical protein [Streptomyces sp. NPDC048111]|uniref:hypothetical protein n=1 Tax=Streptomyces sp. NPDC048111 TaxID=3365500 RepID=UPI003711BF5E